MNRLMRSGALPLAFGFAVALVACGGGSSSQPSSASSAGRDGTYMVCYTESNAHGVTVSAAFRLPAVDAATMLEEPWAKDFRTYVGQSGDAGALEVTCTQVDPKNPDAALKDKIDAWHKQGVNVARVNWKYAGG